MEMSGFETLTDEEIIRRVRGGEKKEPIICLKNTKISCGKKRGHFI